jgi:hypothetical protein
MLIPDPLPNDGINVPLRASFIGIKHVPLLALGHNSLTPRLILFEDRLHTRVFRLRKKPLSAIERIDIFLTIGTRNVQISWKDSLFRFAGNVDGDDWLIATLAYFDRKGVPLTNNVQAYLQQKQAR